MKFEIDLFELSFLAEACIPPTPIARAMFWEKFTFEIHDKLSKDERSRVYEWLMKNHKLKGSIEKGNKEAIMFEARYNPDKQYVVEDYNGNACRTFLVGDRHYTKKDAYIPQENIKSSEKI